MEIFACLFAFPIRTLSTFADPKRDRLRSPEPENCIYLNTEIWTTESEKARNM